jgi:RHS repeat-associated protein
VYTVDGKLIAEYGGQGTNGGTSYLITDHLGSTRLVTDSQGNMRARHDYLPFGEEILAGIGGRTTAQQGYGAADDTRQKFTSKERDQESGLDYFGARYFSSMQGRFTSPDEFSGGPVDVFAQGTDGSAKQPLAYADIAEPQSLNKYEYCYGNPFRYVDPDGHQEKSFIERLKDAFRDLANTYHPTPEPPKPDPVMDQSINGTETTFRDYIQAHNKADQEAGKLILSYGEMIDPTGFAMTIAGRSVGIRDDKDVATKLAMATGGHIFGITSAIGKDSILTKLAEESGASVQKSLDALVTQLAKGNLNPGIGTKHLVGDIFYARARDGARVFFKPQERYRDRRQSLQRQRAEGD